MVGAGPEEHVLALPLAGGQLGGEAVEARPEVPGMDAHHQALQLTRCPEGPGDEVGEAAQGGCREQREQAGHQEQGIETVDDIRDGDWAGHRMVGSPTTEAGKAGDLDSAIKEGAQDAGGE